MLTGMQDYRLPNETNQLGNGRWSKFIAATSQLDVHRVTNSRRVRLTLSPLGKRVHFVIEGAPLGKCRGFPLLRRSCRDPDATGVLIFTRYDRLLTTFEGKQCVAQYAEDRIVFYFQGAPQNVIALVSPHILSSVDPNSLIAMEPHV